VTALALKPELLTGLETGSAVKAGGLGGGSANRVPHSSQKFAVSRFSIPHC
jgi:hypothetical protein